MQKEPAVTVGTIIAIVAAVLVFLDQFGISLSSEQQEAITSLVAVLAPIIVGLVVRQLVVSPATAGEAVAIAKGNIPASPNVPAVAVPGYQDSVARFLGRPKSTLAFHPEADGDGAAHPNGGT